jgi:acyl carrier protein
MSREGVQNQLEPAAVLSWLVPKFATWLEVAPTELDVTQPITQYGLDSISAVTLSVYVEEELGIRLDTAVLWDYPSLESFAAHLSGELARCGVTELPGH